MLDRRTTSEKLNWPKRYSIALIPREPDQAHVRNFQSGIALNFPVHLTLRGRFTPPPNVHVRSIIEVIRDEVCRVLPLRCRLLGPLRIQRNLVWYECGRDCEGYAQLIALHTSLEYRLRQSTMIELDEVPTLHMHEGYRPHVTLAWEEDETVSIGFVSNSPNVLAMSFEEWRLLEYRGPPHLEPVKELPGF